MDRPGTVVTVDDLFPRAATARGPFAAVVGETFETVTLPRRAALEVIGRLGRFQPHPVGAAVCRALTDEWVLILPPGSGFGLEWSWPANHCQKGVLMVPPRAAGPDDDLRWARLGNGEERVFSAPLLLYALFPQLSPRRPHSTNVRADRTPVRI
ncbi:MULTISPECIES: hypothetical protein [Streptomyces]|uniref:Uncharacterized protein n=1 Tax=Streptomyces griseiscabiei TaxID=2993540 RepID=A0ABU4LDZ4_9ACTN|nr:MULTISPECIES: hypothetical protein [Streptomyces]MBZ3908436.1 hypothetical protein [Streptomyces griseiscabiei]MDX2913954.1 hypothetical protein [Streptomyces griseiscabiei]